MQAFCDDCGVEVPLDSSEALTEKLPTPQVELGSIVADGAGYKYADNENLMVSRISSAVYPQDFRT